MQVHQDIDAEHYSIKSYSKGEVFVQIPFSLESAETSDRENSPHRGLSIATLTKSFAISASTLDQNWPPQTIEQLTETDLCALLLLKPEVVIIGTGEHLIWPPRSLMAPLINAGVGYEIMNTAAACRTYNVLSYEGRNVIAALMII